MDNFDAHKWFKKQYLAEDKSDKDKVVAKGDDIEITQKQMERLHNGEVVRLSNGSVLSFVKEGHTEDKMERDMEARKRSKLSPDELKKLDAMVDFRTRKTSNLNENMSPAEAVVELNVYMNELQDISSAVSRIMEQYFPDEFNQGDAYGAFDFGSSRNRFDTTFESILDDLASVGDDME